MKLKDLKSEEWLLISRKDYQDLIDKAASNGVDTDILKAVYNWLIDKNQLLTKKDKK